MERFIFKVAGLTGKIENGTVAFQHAGQRSVFGNVLHQFAGHQRDNSFEALLPVIAFCNRTPKYYGRLVIFLLLHCYGIVKIFQFMCPIVALLIPSEGVAFYFYILITSSSHNYRYSLAIRLDVPKPCAYLKIALKHI